MPITLTEQGLPRPASDIWRSCLGEWDRSLRADDSPAKSGGIAGA